MGPNADHGAILGRYWPRNVSAFVTELGLKQSQRLKYAIGVLLLVCPFGQSSPFALRTDAQHAHIYSHRNEAARAL
jgi:hypothetical protein